MAEWTDGTDDDDDDCDLLICLNTDDVEGLRSFMTRNDMHRYYISSLLRICCDWSSVKCATALLDRTLGLTQDLDEHNLLHHAARLLSPELVELFLCHGAEPDYRYFSNDTEYDYRLLLLNKGNSEWRPLCKLDNGLLPIDIALDRMRWKLGREESILQLIVALCLPEMKSALDTVKLLAGVSEEIEEEAYNYAMRGKVTELAVLLIVAPENVLKGRKMICQRLRIEVLSLITEKDNFFRKNMMKNMRFTALLLEVFERAGHTIKEYLQSQKPDVLREQVEKDVALRLKEAGFKLMDGDFDFSIGNWLNSFDPVRTPIKCIETQSDRSSQFESPHSNLMQQTSGFLPPREWTDGMDDDYYCDMDLKSDISKHLSNDDTEGLKSFMARYDIYRYSVSTLLREICGWLAVKCATALLEGKLGVTVRVDLNGRCLLHLAARCLSPELVQLFLRHGARPDVGFVREDTEEDYGLFPPNRGLGEWRSLCKLDNGLLPLDIALDRMRWKLCREESTFKLMVVLCLPEMKSGLDTVKLLAGLSDNIEEEAYNYAMRGRVDELAVLLIVASENVLNGGMMIRECVRNQVLSLIDEKDELFRKNKHEELTLVHKKMKNMRLTALLLEVFERAGHTIEEYLQSQKPDVLREQVGKDVALRLKEAGFKLMNGDIDFSIVNWLLSFNSVRTPIKCSETQSERLSQSMSPHSHLMQQTNGFFSQKKEIPRDVHGLCPSTSPALRRIHSLSSMRKSVNVNQVPNSIMGSHYSTNVQRKKRGKAIEQIMPKCLSREKLAYVATLIRMGARSF